MVSWSPYCSDLLGSKLWILSTESLTPLLCVFWFESLHVHDLSWYFFGTNHGAFGTRTLLERHRFLWHSLLVCGYCYVAPKSFHERSGDHWSAFCNGLHIASSFEDSSFVLDSRLFHWRHSVHDLLLLLLHCSNGFPCGILWTRLLPVYPTQHPWRLHQPVKQ